MKAKTLKATTNCYEKHVTLHWSLENWKLYYGLDAEIKSKVLEIESRLILYQRIHK